MREKNLLLGITTDGWPFDRKAKIQYVLGWGWGKVIHDESADAVVPHVRDCNELLKMVASQPFYVPR